MNKEEFLNKLKSKISVLNDEEIDDILSEYAGYIDEKVADGKTEKEAVKELGSINEIASDLLDAYKVKSTASEKNIVEKAVEWVTDFVELIISNVKGKSFADILKFLITLGLIFLVILVCKIPFLIVEDAGESIFVSMGSIGKVFSFIWNTLLEFCYLFMAIIAFVAIVKKEFLKEKPKSKIKTKNEGKEKEVNTEKKTISEKKIVPKKNEKKGFISNFGGFLTACVIIFLKFICFWILIGIFGYLVGISVTFAITVYLFIATLKFIGIPIIIWGLLLAGIIFAEINFNFIFNRKTNWKRIFISLIISIVSIGGGVGLTAISAANTNIKKVDTPDTKEVTYKMNDKLVIEDFDQEKYVVDDKVKDIKVVYTYNKTFAKINKSDSDHIKVNEYDYTLDNKKVVKYFLNGLKNDTLFFINDDVVDYKVYISKDNLKTIKSNYNNWLKEIDKNPENNN